MLFNNDEHLGVSEEDTVDNPIVVLGCTVGTFANFLGWLNHKYVCNSSSSMTYSLLIRSVS